MRQLFSLLCCLMLAAIMLVGCSGNDSSDASQENTLVTTKTTLNDSGSISKSVVRDETGAYSPPIISSSNKLTPVVQAALNTGTWPKEMVEISDKEEIKVQYSLDPSDYENVMVVSCSLSSPFCEVIIIKAKDDKVDEAKKALEQNVNDKLIDSMQYSSTIETLKNAKIDFYEQYVYYVAGSQPEKAADAIRNALTSLT